MDKANEADGKNAFGSGVELLLALKNVFPVVEAGGVAMLPVLSPSSGLAIGAVMVELKKGAYGGAEPGDRNPWDAKADAKANAGFSKIDPTFAGNDDEAGGVKCG